jgi:hypothetical protein
MLCVLYIECDKHCPGVKKIAHGALDGLPRNMLKNADGGAISPTGWIFCSMNFTCLDIALSLYVESKTFGMSAFFLFEQKTARMRFITLSVYLTKIAPQIIEYFGCHTFWPDDSFRLYQK